MQMYKYEEWQHEIHLMLPFFTFMNLHLASHLGMLDAQHMDVKHMMMESKQKTVLVDLSRRWKDPWSACLEWKMFSKTVQAN